MKTRGLLLALLLTACGGGGGGGGGGAPPADTTPDPFSFTDQASVEPSATVTSAPVTITGLAAAAPVTVTGGSYSVGCTATYVTTAGSIGNNQQVCVRHTASASFTTPTNTVLTVGGVSDTFTSVTRGAGPNVTLTGAVTYDRVTFASAGNGLDLDNPSTAPVRGATVQLVQVSNQAVLGTTRTDDGGDYSVQGPEGATVFVRVRAEAKKTGGAPEYDVAVIDNTASGALYVLDSPTFTLSSGSVRNLHAATGWNGSSYTGTRAAAPFQVLDSVYVAMQKIIAVDGAVVFPALRVNWSTANRPEGNPADTCATDGRIGTSYYTNGQICLLGAANDDTDEFDRHVVIHEWGHYFEDKLSRSDSIGGSHSGADRLDMRVAYGEGFGNAWSAIATDDPNYRDSGGNGQAMDLVNFNVETNSATNPGWFNESSVQSSLYDFYDSANEAGDGVTLGLAPLYSAWRNEQRTTTALTSIFPLAAALKASQPSSAAGISAILENRSISGDSDAYGNNEDNNAGVANVLPIYTPIAINGAAVPICSIKTFGEYNKLGNWRYLRFTVTNPGVHTFTATGSGADAALELHQAGFVSYHDDDFAPTESFTASLSAGEHIVAVAEYTNIDGLAGGGTVCMNVAITR